jgi:hypothetical protein
VNSRGRPEGPARSLRDETKLFYFNPQSSDRGLIGTSRSSSYDAPMRWIFLNFELFGSLQWSSLFPKIPSLCHVIYSN